MAYDLERKYHEAIQLSRVSNAQITFHDTPLYAVDEIKKMLSGYHDATISDYTLVNDSFSTPRPFRVHKVKFEHGGEITLFTDIQLPDGYQLMPIVKDNESEEADD